MNEFEELYRTGAYQVSEFGRHEYWARVLSQTRIINQLGMGLTVLDIGCGKGEVSRFLRSDFIVYGLDPSWTALRQAQQFLSSANVGNVYQIPYIDEFFDAVIMVETLYYNGLADRPNTLRAFAEIKRVLKRGGAFVLANGLVNDPAFWYREARVWLFQRIPPRLFALARRLLGKPPKDPSSYSRYVLTAGEIGRLLRAAGFVVEGFYPYFLYVPLLSRHERWLPLTFRLGNLYPMLARYGLFVARSRND